MALTYSSKAPGPLLGESIIADTLHKGDHVLVDGHLVSSKYEHENSKCKKAKAAKFAIFWVRARTPSGV